MFSNTFDSVWEWRQFADKVVILEWSGEPPFSNLSPLPHRIARVPEGVKALKGLKGLKALKGPSGRPSNTLSLKPAA